MSDSFYQTDEIRKKIENITGETARDVIKKTVSKMNKEGKNVYMVHILREYDEIILRMHYRREVFKNPYKPDVTLHGTTTDLLTQVKI
jgi:archaeosine-15-forming tRNA-guanine transglycosylase